MQGDPDYDPSEDWQSDCKGQQGLDYPNLLGALFELADTWWVGFDWPSNALW